MPKAVYRGSEPAALRELMRALGMRPDQAARVLGVPERDVALWLTGNALIPGDPERACCEVAKALIDWHQAQPSGYVTVEVADVAAAVDRRRTDDADTPEVTVHVPPEAI